MSEAMEEAAVRVIDAMHKRIGEEFPVDDMARIAMYSKFHFSRAFRQVTGVSPGRFLAALRFQEAKRMLVASPLSVAEISNEVGYSSLGTFSTRFKRCVGVTPTEYRHTGGRRAPALKPGGHHDGRATQTLRGQVWGGALGPVYIGVYDEPFPSRCPVRATVLRQPGPFALDGIPEGSWYLLAHATVDGAGSTGAGHGIAPASELGSVGRGGPLVVRPRESPAPATVWLRSMRPVDFPVLSAPVTAAAATRRRWRGR